MNYKLVTNTIGKVLLIEAALMLLPMVVSIIYTEKCIVSFAITIGIAAVLGLIMSFAVKTTEKNIYIKDGFAIVSLSWLLISAIGALPFVISGEIPSYIDAFFETASGFTTTGASIVTNVEALSHGILFWRSFTHWIGGMGILVFVMALLDKVPDRSVNILRAEMPGHSLDKLAPKSKNTAKILYYIYIVFTVVEILLLLVGGMPLFDSVVHSLGTAGTGGFGIKADSIASYSPYCQWIITIFMLLFGVSFNIYYLILVRKCKNILESNELFCYLGIFAVATAAIAINISTMYKSIAETIRLSAFQVASLVTTTGYATANFDTWPQFSKAILLLLMFVGGCMGSTAGGLKVSRVVVLFQTAKNNLKRCISPRSVQSVKLNGRALDAQAEKDVLAYFSVYCLILIATFLLISFEDFGLETNLSAAISCFNNIGPGFALVGPAESFAIYSPFSKIVLSLAMLLGRLEIYPFVALFIKRS